MIPPAWLIHGADLMKIYLSFVLCVVGVVTAAYVARGRSSRSLRTERSVPLVDSEWTPAVPLTRTGGLFYGLAAAGDALHLVYGDGQVFYRKGLSDGGGRTSWTEPISLASSASIMFDRSIVANGSRVYVIYGKNLSSFTDTCCSRYVGDLYFRASLDGGSTFGTEVQLTHSGKVFRIALAVSESAALLVYQDFRSGTTWDLYARRGAVHPDGTVSWLPESKLVEGIGPTGAQRPDVILSGSAATVFWMDGRGSPPSACFGYVGCTQIFSMRSNNEGTTWSTPAAPFPAPRIYQGRPIVAATGSGALTLVWEQGDANNTHDTPFVSRSTDGVSWDPPQPLTTHPQGGSHPWVSASGTTVIVAWHDFRTGNDTADIFARRSTNDARDFVAEEQVAATPGNSVLPMIAFTPSVGHVIWADTTGGAAQVWYSRRPVPPAVAASERSPAGRSRSSASRSPS